MAYGRCEWDLGAKAWDEIARDQGTPYQRAYIDPIMMKIIGPVRGKRMLEIGCGNGYFSRKLARCGAKAVGTDVSDAMIRHARKREEENPTGARFFRRDAARLSGFRKSSFDLAVANMCLMDMPDAKGAIRRAAGLLKPGGRLIFSITHPLTCDFTQQWRIHKVGKKRYFGRFVYRYLTPFTHRVNFWISGNPLFMKRDYHRPIGEYVHNLLEAGLDLTHFKELRAHRKVIRAPRGSGDISMSRTKYRTPAEKEMKVLAGREIPLFLVIAAQKRR